ncbi:mucin-2 [Rhopalosiphum maidis]|uniref:mucin-2 n=1 Tax=Rhopalosiphum maidis TaxID=43146 RepID=UPI000EFF4616|nr:mucin-2 [Rhopalosiphum maidis]
MIAKMRCLFVVNVLVLKIVVGAAEIPNGQAPWTHKDTGATSAGTTMTDGRNVISPRMDFEEWTPLGRGDPLKNDPTFDYLPPVLDRVHYWKPPPPATNRAHYYSSASTATPTTPPSQVVHGGYNRRFFLTDFSKREPVVAAYAAIKRPPPSNSLLQPHHHHQHNHHHPQQQQQIQHHLQTLQSAPAAGYHYSMHPAAPVPRTPLPMLTPPPYQQWPSTVSDVQRQSSMSSSSLSPDVPGNAAAESKQPPPTMVRAPTRPASPSSNHLAVVKALLDDEVDRTAVTTTGAAITAAVWTTTTMPPPVTMTPPPPSQTATSMTAAVRTTPSVVSSDPLFSHYRQSPVTGRPMYLIIQGHSKVKTYGPASKVDDLNAAPAIQDHNHIGSQPPDEPSRRKRDHYYGSRR